jgi:hypothetical protein
MHDLATTGPPLSCVAARNKYLDGAVRQNNPTGKSSLPIFGIRVKPQNKKYFAFSEPQITVT